MVQITVSIEIEAPPERVWAEVADLASHAEWMADAESIVFLTDQRSGSGTRLRVSTRVGPIRTGDVMEIVEWVEHQTIGVRHEGLVGGRGRFSPECGGATRNDYVTGSKRLQIGAECVAEIRIAGFVSGGEPVDSLLRGAVSP